MKKKMMFGITGIILIGIILILSISSLIIIANADPIPGCTDEKVKNNLYGDFDKDGYSNAEELGLEPSFEDLRGIGFDPCDPCKPDPDCEACKKQSNEKAIQDKKAEEETKKEPEQILKKTGEELREEEKKLEEAVEELERILEEARKELKEKELKEVKEEKKPVVEKKPEEKIIKPVYPSLPEKIEPLPVLPRPLPAPLQPTIEERIIDIIKNWWLPIIIVIIATVSILSSLFGRKK